MRIDRSTASARSRLIQAGHTVACAQFGAHAGRFDCKACYGPTGDHGNTRPRSMEAAYAALTPGEQAVLGRHRAARA